MQKAAVKKSKGTKGGGAQAARPAQDRFLTEMAEDRRAVAIFLVNGLKLEGKIVSFDDYAILLEGEMSDHVYKHAISTIQPLDGAAVAPDAGAKPGARAGAKAGAMRVAPQFAAPAQEAKPRQPTIVVRAKRRVIKRDDG
jgi:host factor-I protein